MKKSISTFIVAGFISFAAFGQVQINKSINLNGSGTDAKITGIKDVSVATDAVSAEVVQKGSLVYAGTSSYNSGTNTYTVTLAPALASTLASYPLGMMVNFKADLPNTGTPPTKVKINPTTLTADIKKDVSNNLAANDIAAGQLITLIYDGSNFQLLSRTFVANTGGTVTSIATTDGITGGTINLSGTIGLTGQAYALHNLGTNGLIARTGAGAVAGRTLTGTATRIAVTNGDGVSGNPTIDLVTLGTATTYTKVTTDAYGRVASGTTLGTGDIPDLSATYIKNSASSQNPGTFNIAGSGTIGGTLNTTNILTAGNNLNLSGGGWGMTFAVDIDNNSADNYIFSGNGAEIMRLTDDGKLGIGTSNPTRKLTVDYPGSTANYAPVEIKGAGVHSWGIGLIVRTTGGTDGAAILFRNRDVKNWQIRGQTSGTGFQITEDGGDAESGSDFGTARMHFSAGGNVGIGNTAPGAKLDVTGSITAASSDGVNAEINVGKINSVGNPGSGYNSALIRFRGNYAYNNPWDSDNSDEMWMGRVNYANNQSGLFINVGDDADNNDALYVGITQSNLFYRKWWAGGNGGYGTYSDERLKKDITPMTNVLNRVLSLKGVTYRWKEQNSDSARPIIGFIAQDIQRAFPEMVETDESGMLKVNHGGFPGLFIEAIKEQQKTIADLNKQVNELKAAADNKAVLTEVERLKAEVEQMKRMMEENGIGKRK